MITNESQDAIINIEQVRKDLLEAVKANDFKKTEELLPFVVGEEVNDGDGITLLFIACREGFL